MIGFQRCSDQARSLFQAHIKDIRGIVQKQTRGLVGPDHLHYDDYYQHGLVGALKALESANMSANWRGYVKVAVRNSIRNAIEQGIAGDDLGYHDELRESQIPNMQQTPELGAIERELIEQINRCLSSDASRLFDLCLRPTPELTVTTRNIKGTAAVITLRDIGVYTRMPKGRVARAYREIRQAIGLASAA